MTLIKQLLLLAGLAVVCLFLFPLSNTHNWGGDFSLYIHQAQSLAGGTTEEVATTNAYALQHSSYGTFSPALYPWGWPILLAPVVAIAGLNYVWMKVYVLLFFLGILALAYRYFAPEIGKVTSFLVAACLLVNSNLFWYTDNVLSEFPFLFFVLLSLFLYRYLQKETRHRWWHLMVGSFCLFFTAIIRSEGYLLLLAFAGNECVTFLLSKTKKEFLRQNKWQLVLWGGGVVWHVIYSMVLPQGSGAHLGHFKLEL